MGDIIDNCNINNDNERMPNIIKSMYYENNINATQKLSFVVILCLLPTGMNRTLYR